MSQIHIVSWEPEGRYCRSKMFRWEPEGRYCHWLCTAIAPFSFSTEHLCSAITPYWFSTDDIYRLADFHHPVGTHSFEWVAYCLWNSMRTRALMHIAIISSQWVIHYHTAGPWEGRVPDPQGAASDVITGLYIFHQYDYICLFCFLRVT